MMSSQLWLFEWMTDWNGGQLKAKQNRFGLEQMLKKNGKIAQVIPILMSSATLRLTILILLHIAHCTYFDK